MVQIHRVYTGPVRNWNCVVPYGITFISGPIWHQIADPIRTGSARSRVNSRLIRTNFVPVPVSKRCLKNKVQMSDLHKITSSRLF